MSEPGRSGESNRSLESFVKADLEELRRQVATDVSLSAELSDQTRSLLALINRARVPEERIGPILSDRRATGQRINDDENSPERSGSVPSQIGPYRIEERIATGGMGVVFRVSDIELNRVVALKMMAAGPFADQNARERFRGEAESAARLDHPGIVPVFDVGQYHGQPYFTMGYVEGESLAARISRGPLAANDAAELTRQIALAIDYAHAHDVVHRDLKPSNVLLDRQGQSRITDFGLARRVDSGSDLTRTGQVIGTPQYMSPEQAAGDLDRVTSKSDVYSIGATLYAMLTGHPPFQSSSTVEMLRMVLEREPIPPRQLNPAIAVDLSTICLKCLQKNPAERYASAGELADDVQRFLEDKPVRARMPARAVRILRWGRRRPLAAALIMLLLGLAIAGPLVALRQAQLYREAERARAESRRILYRSDMNLAMRDWDDANIERCGTLLKRHVPAPGEEDLRGFEWFYLWRLWQQSSAAPVIFHNDRLESMALSPDESLMAVGDFDGGIALVDVDSGQVLKQWQAHPYRTFAIEFAADGKVLASASVDDEVALWEIPSGDLIRKLSGSRAICFSPDGKTFAYRTAGMSIAILDDLRGEPRIIKDAHSFFIGDLAFSSDGLAIASAGWDSRVRVWDVASGQLQHDLLEHSGSAVWTVGWSADGNYLASGDTHGKIVVWNAQDGSPLLKLEQHRDTINQITFSENSDHLVSASADNTVKLWSIPTGRLQRTLRGHFADVVAARFAVQRNQLMTAGTDGNVKAWPFTDDAVEDVLDHPSIVNSLAFSPDGARLATLGLDGKLRIWGTAKGVLQITQPAHDDCGWGVQWFARGKQEYLASTGGDGKLCIWRVGHQLELVEQIPCYQNSSNRLPVAVDDRGLLIVFPDSRLTCAIWDLDANRLRQQLKTGTADGFSFIGGKALAVSAAQRIQCFELGTGRLLTTVQGDSRAVTDLDTAANGLHLASASYDRTIKIWDVRMSQEAGPLRLVQTLRGHAGPVQALQYSNDGTLISSTGEEETVRLWDVAGGYQRAAFIGHTDDVNDVAFSPNGAILATASNDGTVRLWRAPRQ